MSHSRDNDDYYDDRPAPSHRQADDYDDERRPSRGGGSGSGASRSDNASYANFHRRDGGNQQDRGDRGDRRDRGARDRPRNTACFNCGEEGHKSFECTQEKKSNTRRSYNDDRDHDRGRNDRDDRRGGGRGFDDYDNADKPNRRSEFGDHWNSHKKGAAGGGGRRDEAPRRDDRDRDRDRRGHDGERGEGKQRESQTQLDAELNALQLDDPKRPKLQLKPKSVQPAPIDTAKGAPLNIEAYGKTKPNPFGDAKPREFNLKPASGSPSLAAASPALKPQGSPLMHS